MKDLKLNIGDRIESKKVIMVITAETEKAYTGHIEYKGKMVDKCVILKETLSNPYYKKDIKILNN